MPKVWLEWDEIYPVYFVSREDEPVVNDAICVSLDAETLDEWLRVQSAFDGLQAELRKIREVHEKTVAGLKGKAE